MRSDCPHHGHTVLTLCTHCVCAALTCLFPGALQMRQGRAQKAPPASNVFYRRFCTCTSRSGQQIRYGWRAKSLQSWVVWLHALMTVHIM